MIVRVAKGVAVVVSVLAIVVAEDTAVTKAFEMYRHENVLSCTSELSRVSALELLKKKPFEVMMKDEDLDSNVNFFPYAFQVLAAGVFGKSPTQKDVENFYKDSDLVMDQMTTTRRDPDQVQCRSYVRMLNKRDGTVTGSVPVQVVISSRENGPYVEVYY
jgi:hypothetical protein